MYSPEVSAAIQSYRERVRAGTLTLDDMREALSMLRNGRAAAARTSTASRTKHAATKAPVASGEDLLSELEGL